MSTGVRCTHGPDDPRREPGADQGAAARDRQADVLHDGYHPTSLEKVADAAGYSKGAVYSNFRNKDELCTAVLDEVRAERLGEVLELIVATGQVDRGDPRLGANASSAIQGGRRWKPSSRCTRARTSNCAPNSPAAWTASSKCSPRHGIRRRSRPQDAQPRSGHRHARARRRARSACARSIPPYL